MLDADVTFRPAAGVGSVKLSQAQRRLLPRAAARTLL